MRTEAWWLGDGQSVTDHAKELRKSMQAERQPEQKQEDEAKLGESLYGIEHLKSLKEPQSNLEM
jgi:hypothetical protein